MVMLAMGVLGTVVGWYIMRGRGQASPALLAVQATAMVVLSALLLTAWLRLAPQRLIEVGCLAFAVAAFVACMALRMYSPRYGSVIDLQPLYLWFPALYVVAFTLTDHRRGLVISLAIMLLFVGVSLPYLVHNIDGPYANFTVQLHVASAALIAALYFFSRYQHRLRLAQVTVEQLARLSSTDELTGLANRRGMAMAIGAELAEASHDGDGLAVLLFDVDHFKTINDCFGHGSGDEVLVALAARAASALGPGATLGRWGGDEFVALLRHVARDDAMHRANALCARIASKPLSGDRRVTVSCGVAMARPGDDIDSLLRRADAALYAAKRAGRNCAAGISDPATALVRVAPNVAAA